MKLLISIFSLLLLTLPSFAFAHAVEGNGFMAGVTHPVGGLDHLLAMLSVGILSTQLGGKHVWTVPLTFVLVMLVGGIAGFQGVDMPMEWVELGIVASVVLLGFVIACEGKLPLLLIYTFVAIFGFFHGFAHGVEIPIKANPAFFAAGFLISTILIHIVGVFIGLAYAKGKEKGMLLLRLTGAAIFGAGLHMLAGL